MSYYDPDTKLTYDKSPTDFIDPNNVKYNWRGNIETLNPNFDQAKYDQQWKAWNDYKATQVDQAKVVPFDVNNNVPNDPNHDFGTQGQVPPPDVPGGHDTPGKGVTAVSTDAMKTFVSNLKQLNDPLQTSYTKLGTVDVRAGGFHEAFTLRDKIMGDTGLAASTQKFIGNTRETLADIANAADALALKYTNAEDFNSMTGADLGTYVSELNGDINGLGSH
jgi:hypothetical protein